MFIKPPTIEGYTTQNGSEFAIPNLLGVLSTNRMPMTNDKAALHGGTACHVCNHVDSGCECTLFDILCGRNLLKN